MNKKKTAIVITLVVVILLIILAVLLLNRKCTVTFDSKGGTEITSQKISKNSTVQKPENPTKEGYAFAGWYISETEQYNFNTAVNSDITLTAKWVAIQKEEITEPKKEDSNNSDSNGLSQIRIVTSKTTLTVDDTTTLSLKTEPEDIKIDNSDITWTSSNTKVAKVNKNGKVTAISAGTATITAKVNGVSATTKITVKSKTTSTTTNTSSNNNTSSTSKVTYTYKWEKIDSSVIGQYYLYIVSSAGKKVAGTATVTTKSGVSETVSIPASGKIYVKDTIASVLNVKAN